MFMISQLKSFYEHIKLLILASNPFLTYKSGKLSLFYPQANTKSLNLEAFKKPNFSISRFPQDLKTWQMHVWLIKCRSLALSKTFDTK